MKMILDVVIILSLGLAVLVSLERWRRPGFRLAIIFVVLALALASIATASLAIPHHWEWDPVPGAVGYALCFSFNVSAPWDMGLCANVGNVTEYDDAALDESLGLGWRHGPTVVAYLVVAYFPGGYGGPGEGVDAQGNPIVRTLINPSFVQAQPIP